MAAPCRGRCLLKLALNARTGKSTVTQNVVNPRYFSRCTSRYQLQDEESTGKEKKISMAMKVYLEKAKQHDAFMEKEIAEYELGKRHLANIMGVDPENFGQSDIDKAIEYLLPSGLFDKQARPLMKHPVEVIPQRLAAQFDEDGRPFHHLFYTGSPQFFSLMQSFGEKLDSLKELEDRRAAIGQRLEEENKIKLESSRWMTQEELEKVVKEKITEPQYAQFLTLMKRVVDQPYAFMYRNDVLQYRVKLQEVNMLKTTAETQKTEDGRVYTTSDGMRKRANANVSVYADGSGKFTVNGQDLLAYFPDVKERTQVAFPLQLSSMLGTVDVSAEVSGGGPSGQAGAIRLALSRALTGMVETETQQAMRLAGLLTSDPRRRERKKFGQRGAREKFTWKAR